MLPWLLRPPARPLPRSPRPAVHACCGAAPSAVASRRLSRVWLIWRTCIPAYPRLFQERGHCYAFLKQAPEAVRAFSRAVALNPALPASWRMLASLYRMVGRKQESAIAAQHVAKLATLATEVVTARSMLADGNLREAEDLIRGYLRRKPDDIEALARSGAGSPPERILEGCGDAARGRAGSGARLSPGPPRLRAGADCPAPSQAGPRTDRDPDRRGARQPDHRTTLAEHPGGRGIDRGGHCPVRRTAAAAARRSGAASVARPRAQDSGKS